MALNYGMKGLLAHLRSELDGVAAGRRDNWVSLDDLLGVVLRMDPYTMEAAKKLRIEPERVTPQQREAAKREVYIKAFEPRIFGTRTGRLPGDSPLRGTDADEGQSDLQSGA